MVLWDAGGPILDAWVQLAIFASEDLGILYHLEVHLTQP